jgi:hypothetical protein
MRSLFFHSEFPESWSDDKILGSVLKVIDNPSSVKSPFIGNINNINYENVVDGVKIRVGTEMVGETLRIITGFPI